MYEILHHARAMISHDEVRDLVELIVTPATFARRADLYVFLLVKSAGLGNSSFGVVPVLHPGKRGVLLLAASSSEFSS